MPSIVYDDFSGGMDRRKSRDTAAANQLYLLKNCRVTNGKEIEGRPGLTKIATLEAGTKGLRSASGKLQTFYSIGTVVHSNTLFNANKVPHPTLAGQNVAACRAQEVFEGYLYLVIEYENGDIYHHYLDDPGAWASNTAYVLTDFRRPTTANGFRYECTTAGTSSASTEPTWPTSVGATVADGTAVWTCRAYSITDTNCPHTAAIAKQASKIYAIKDDVVRFCATADARDWTTANDAGFIASGLQETEQVDALALAPFQKQLAVFFANGVQIWDTDPDPDFIVLAQKIFNIGTRYPESPSIVSSDTFFLSDHGFRSLSLASQSVNNTIEDIDVGSPVDKPVKADLVTGINPISIFYPGDSQHWTIIGSKAWTYSYSRISKIAAWQFYEFPFEIDAAAVLDGELYLRAGNDVYRADEDVYTDDGTVIEHDIEFAYLDMKKPGIMKTFWGMDVIGAGTMDLQSRFDPRDDDAITEAVPMTDNTLPDQITPVELAAVAIAPRITHAADERFAINRLIFYYENDSPFGG